MVETPDSQSSRSLPVYAPKDYFLGPVFAASKQSGPRIVIIGTNRYEVGGFHPLMRTTQVPPALDVRHARAIFTMLSFRDPYDESGNRLIRFSMTEFCRRYARTNGGRYSRDIKYILQELLNSYIRVVDLTTNEGHIYRLIEDLDIHEKPIRRRDAKAATDRQYEIWFNGCTLSREFYGLLNRIAELQYLNLRVFTSIRSPLAQAIYLYIPSRADHRGENDPFEINLKKLLEQVSFRPPDKIPRQKNRRRQIFTQHESEGRSIMQQLDGLETLRGRFRVRLAETSDGTDWKLLSWVEKSERKPALDASESKMVAAYLKSGRPPELLAQAFAEPTVLSTYELDLLRAAKIEVGRCARFLEKAKALLRVERFDELLAEAKNNEQEGRKARLNQTARLIHRIMEAIKAPVGNGERRK
jgi:hypothetical protein